MWPAGKAHLTLALPANRRYPGKTPQWSSDQAAILGFHKYMSQPASQAAQTPPRPPRDWVAIAAASLPGVAALVALIFAWLSITATNDQLKVAEQGQITDRYNAAITNLGASSIDVRLGGIYALQRLMQDSRRDQATVVATLCAFVREHTASTVEPQKPPASPQPTDIQAALTVVGTRTFADDVTATVVDLNRAVLAKAQLGRGNLNHANLKSADLTHANLTGADLTGAHLTGANLTRAILGAAVLTRAFMFRANLTQASLDDADLTGADLHDAHLTGASLGLAHLSHAELISAFLSGAFLGRADLRDADLSGADLRGADLGGADLRGAFLGGTDLRGANLTHADLRGADLTGADLTHANLTGANLKGARGIPTASPQPS
jgi:uncharacterized protein YjbI with pentapeptide repeats